MSVLETPRLIFRGRVTWDPIVTNNSSGQYDENDAETVFDSTAPDVAAFRKAAIDDVIATSNGQDFISNWNPHGTHRSTFYETSVTAVDTGSGLRTDDPIVASLVSFRGMLVDAEPYGAYSSQLFFDDISFGIQGGCRVFAPRATRMTARYINFRRNPAGFIAGIASVVWQTSFPKADGLRVDAHDSPALQKFVSELEKDSTAGLTIRWNAYRTIYFDSLDPNQNDLAVARQLQSALAGGGFQPNPSRSEVVGVLGLWRKGEPACEPGDRALLTRQAAKIASAHVRLTNNQLVLDFANSIPETGLDLTKANLGNLAAVAVSPDGTTVLARLGTFGYDAYDRKAYERSAGIITLNVDPDVAEKAQKADIQLRQTDENGPILLAEAALRAIPATPNVYLDQGETTALDVLVLDRGLPAGAGIPVAMADPAASTAASVTQKTDARGIATFPLAGTSGQVESFVLVPGQSTPLPPQVDPQTTTYVYVRTLPADADIARMPPTWDNVHRYVLRNWHAMAPCMDNWLDLGDPDQIRSFAPMLRCLTDRANLERFRFMPVTRDMTAGQRTLLYAFLDGTGQPMATMAAAPSPRPLTRLSRGVDSAGA